MEFEYSGKVIGNDAFAMIPRSIPQPIRFYDYLDKTGRQDLLQTIPFDFLQQSECTIIEDGEYYNRDMGNGFTISIHVSGHSVSFTTKITIDNKEQFKRLYYDVYNHVISFRWSKNDEIESTHFMKRYRNDEKTSLSPNTELTPEELKTAIEELFSEVSQYVGLEDIISQHGTFAEIRENIMKYLGGIKR